MEHDSTATPSTIDKLVITLSCPDQPGIVHAASGIMSDIGGNIIQSQQFGDPDTGLFFMRMEAESPVGRGPVEEGLTRIADKFNATWRVDQLYGVPFLSIPVTKDSKARAEAELLDLIKSEQVELVVLARYMQILSDSVCREMAGRVINIHHSFLPSFKGARPYAQAHERGVKLIGATAHYVTADLDEGPIIEQDVTRVTHADSTRDMVELGQDVERRVLAQAVRWHAERRVLMNGNRTVVFSR